MPSGINEKYRLIRKRIGRHPKQILSEPGGEADPHVGLSLVFYSIFSPTLAVTFLRGPVETNVFMLEGFC